MLVIVFFLFFFFFFFFFFCNLTVIYMLAARGISLYTNSDKTDLMCFNKDSVISSLNGMPLKLVDHFI